MPGKGKKKYSKKQMKIAGVARNRRGNPGSKLKTAVTKKSG